jgi:hypothetical protein
MATGFVAVFVTVAETVGDPLIVALIGPDKPTVPVTGTGVLVIVTGVGGGAADGLGPRTNAPARATLLANTRFSVRM